MPDSPWAHPDPAKVRLYLSGHFDGLTEPEMEVIDSHLSGCRGCAELGELDDYMCVVRLIPEHRVIIARILARNRNSVQREKEAN